MWRYNNLQANPVIVPAKRRGAVIGVGHCIIISIPRNQKDHTTAELGNSAIYNHRRDCSEDWLAWHTPLKSIRRQIRFVIQARVLDREDNSISLPRAYKHWELQSPHAHIEQYAQLWDRIEIVDRDDVRRSMAVPACSADKCRQSLPTSILYYNVQRSRMVSRPHISKSIFSLDMCQQWWIRFSICSVVSEVHQTDTPRVGSDYINPIDLCNRLNTYIVPEAAVQGFLTLLFLINGYWIALALNLPLLAFNAKKWEK